MFASVSRNQTSTYLLTRRDVNNIWGSEDSIENTELVSKVFSSTLGAFDMASKIFCENGIFLRNPHIVVQINGRDNLIITVTPAILFTNGKKSQFYFLETGEEAIDHILISRYPPQIQRTRSLLLYRAMLCHFAEKQFQKNKTFSTTITWDDILQFIADVSKYDPRALNNYHPGVAVALDVERKTGNIYNEPLINYFKFTQPEDARHPENIRQEMVHTANRIQKLLQFAKLNPALRIRYKKGFIKPYASGSPATNM